jgi:DNA-binding LacI/PurR family transcriptional regulator
MAATLSDVARASGVSVTTVSNVVNGVQKVAPQTVMRVRAAIEQLDYRPNGAARTMRGQRSGVISLVVPELDLPYFAALAASMIEAANARGYQVITEQTNRDRDREFDAAQGIRRPMTDGLIIFPTTLTEADVPLIHAAGPTIMLSDDVGTTVLDHVTERDAEAAAAGTEHLLSLGHRVIALIGPSPDDVAGGAGLRALGYRRAIAAAGIAYRRDLVEQAVFWQRAEGAGAAAALLDRRPDITAFFALNDTLALGAMHEISRRGLRIPADISILGWDDLEEGQYHFPQLSTVDGGRHELAAVAVDALLRRIESPDAPPQRFEVPFRVVRRSSTGPLSDVRARRTSSSDRNASGRLALDESGVRLE